MQICKVDFAIFSQKATKKRPFGRFFHSFTHSLIHDEDIKAHNRHYTGNDVP